MLSEWQYFPDVMTSHDLHVMREALQSAKQRKEFADEVWDERLAQIILQYYRRGMTDPERLAAIATFMSSSRVFVSAIRGSEAGQPASFS
jgi:hypothetical protein